MNSSQLRPTEFPEANKVLYPPFDLAGAQPLHVYTDGQICVSLWQMTWRQRLRALVTGRIWLGVLSGHRQPPLWIDGGYPFLPAAASEEA